MEFLGITIDDHLTCIPHVNLAMKTSKLFLMRQLAMLGMNLTGFCNSYCSNIRSTCAIVLALIFNFDQTKLSLFQAFCW